MLIHSEEHQLVIHSPAKLNLFLDILSKREDGFHEIETLMTTVGLYDSLSFRENVSDEITLTVQNVTDVSPPGGRDIDCQILPADQSNLILRAAKLLNSHTGHAFGADIRLIKRIPIAAGLAGGSGNAAATLIGLNRLWKLGLPLEELSRLSLKLGSDIPFFLSGAKSAICRGRGEIIEPVRIPAGMNVVIAKPFTGNSTAEVYRHCCPSEQSRSVNQLVEKLKAGNTGQIKEYIYNGLQKPAEDLNPEVGEMSKLFSMLPFDGHLMSGSGSSYFGLCANRAMALSLSRQIKTRHPGFVCATQIGL